MTTFAAEFTKKGAAREMEKCYREKVGRIGKIFDFTEKLVFSWKICKIEIFDDNKIPYHTPYKPTPSQKENEIVWPT